jgi:DNA-directed RNA polymerase subunit RPC12/RpoP
MSDITPDSFIELCAVCEATLKQSADHTHWWCPDCGLRYEVLPKLDVLKHIFMRRAISIF